MAAKRSAGVLLWRRSELGVEVLLGHPGGPLFARKDVWTIPKGEYDDSEPALTAAYREFAEEIGVEVPVAAPDGDPVPLGEVRQSGGKLVRVWAVEGDLDVTRVTSNLFGMEWPPRSGREQLFPEIDRAAWFALADGRAAVFPAQQAFLDRLAALTG